MAEKEPVTAAEVAIERKGEVCEGEDSWGCIRPSLL